MSKFPGIHGKDRQRCGAIAHSANPARVRGRRCRNWPVDGMKRCRFHGGLSTGPKTPEGKARAIAAMVAGRKLWLERKKRERTAATLEQIYGVPFTFDPPELSGATRE